MSHAPFDGVILDDPRPPVPGATAMLLHLRVEQERARRQGRKPLGRTALQARSAACRELLAHGLGPEVLRALESHGLGLGNPRRPHDLAALAEHLEAYLRAVDAAGFLEPDRALWEAVTRETQGERALWVERGDADGPLEAGLRDLAPARLRVLACLDAIGPVRFRLATRRAGASSGLFGSGLPLADWFLEGLEAHGHAFPNELILAEPEGWGEVPWARTLENLFEAPMDLAPYARVFRRGLVEGPFDLQRHAVEQILAWVEEGIAPEEITLVHPAPASVAPTLEALLAAEGVRLQLRGEPRPLLASRAWNPLWALLEGLVRLDPVRFATGLGASTRRELRLWADTLGRADQNGAAAFAAALDPLEDPHRKEAERLWMRLESWRQDRLPAHEWAQRLAELRTLLRPGGNGEAFFAPHALLLEAWDGTPWSLAEMLGALRLFLEAAREAAGPQEGVGVRLLPPDGLFDDWTGSRVALVLDLREGAWPATPESNPDLDGDRKAAINAALLQATRVEGGGSPFPPALQRFWLPRCEQGEILPRAFQREAYALNKLLALTREQVVLLSPGQDAEGRPAAQGPFWTALEGAAAWTPDPERACSRFRMAWEGHARSATIDARALASKARSLPDALEATAPAVDGVPAESLRAWRNREGHVSPTGLESLALCPFRALAGRVWHLEPDDAASRVSMARGTLVHAQFEALLQPFLGRLDWPLDFRKQHGLDDEAEPAALLRILEALWETHREASLAALADLPAPLRREAGLGLEALLPNLASALGKDLASNGPTRQELALLHPELEIPPSTRNFPLKDGWTRTLLGTETILGPLELDLGEGLRLSVQGKADRLERFDHPDAPSFLRITDYKTSRKSRLRSWSEGEAPFSTHLQIPLYLLLAERQFELPATAVLLPLREEDPVAEAGMMKALAASALPWRDRLLQRIGGLWRRALAGDFPPTPGEACQHCAFGALCARPVDIETEEEA